MTEKYLNNRKEHMNLPRFTNDWSVSAIFPSDIKKTMTYLGPPISLTIFVYKKLVQIFQKTIPFCIANVKIHNLRIKSIRKLFRKLFPINTIDTLSVQNIQLQQKSNELEWKQKKQKIIETVIIKTKIFLLKNNSDLFRNSTSNKSAMDQLKIYMVVVLLHLLRKLQAMWLSIVRGFMLLFWLKSNKFTNKTAGIKTILF